MSAFSLQLPAWYASFATTQDFMAMTSDESRLAFAIALAKLNVENQTGGPFGAAIFCNDSGKLLAAGVNVVLPQTTSLAHAECVAIGIAQQGNQSHDLSQPSGTTLYCSAQPCIMCFGAIWWSGITRVLCAARASDVEELTGFVEGPVPANWESLLKNRAPLPAVDVLWSEQSLRNQARAVLKSYKDSGAKIYNAGSSK